MCAHGNFKDSCESCADESKTIKEQIDKTQNETEAETEIVERHREEVKINEQVTVKMECGTNALGQIKEVANFRILDMFGGVNENICKDILNKIGADYNDEYYIGDYDDRIYSAKEAIRNSEAINKIKEMFGYEDEVNQKTNFVESYWFNGYNKS